MHPSLQAVPQSSPPPTTDVAVKRCVVSVVGRTMGETVTAAVTLEGRLRQHFPDLAVVLLVADPVHGAGAPLRSSLGDKAESGDPAAKGKATLRPPWPDILHTCLQEGLRQGATAMALVSAAPHDPSLDWLGTLLAPALGGEFDFVSPLYDRHRTEAAINTGIVYPLTRALFGRDLRFPLGEETVISAPLARRLLDDPDWRRRPDLAGTDAWLVTKVLTSDTRLCQTWIGAWPRPEGPPEELSQVLARTLAAVFVEMERYPHYWQRSGAPRSVPTLGAPGVAQGDAPRPNVQSFGRAFELGLRELSAVWSPVLPPSTLLALQRFVGQPIEQRRWHDRLWARIVYDFAVAHMVRAVERHQLLLSMTPLYLGWLAGFVQELEPLGPSEAEGRVQQLCGAFDAEKEYLIARWRWPDSFTP